MRIIRHRSYTRRSAYFYGVGAVLVVGAFLAIFAFHRGPITGVLPLAGLFALLFLMKAFLPAAETWIKGQRGENRALDALRGLPDTYAAVTNFAIPESKRGDIDLMVIGPMGIATCEVKTYPGTIVYRHKRWWRRQRSGWETRLPKNVSAQARGHRKDIIGYLKAQHQRDPALANLFVPVIPAIVFVATERLETEELDMAALKVDDFAEWVVSLPARLTEAQVTRVAALFEPGGPNAPSMQEATRQPGRE